MYKYIFAESGESFTINNNGKITSYDFNNLPQTTTPKISTLYGEALTIQTINGNMLLEVDGKNIRILNSPCPDKICVKSGVISNDGEFIVCVPDQISISINSKRAGYINGIVR